MLFRFSLYGFLKNQRYFEPFFLLLLLDKGLSFFTVGLLIAFRDVAINVLEIPSGAIADLAGRRRSMAGTDQGIRRPHHDHREHPNPGQTYVPAPVPRLCRGQRPTATGRSLCGRGYPDGCWCGGGLYSLSGP